MEQEILKVSDISPKTLKEVKGRLYATDQHRVLDVAKKFGVSYITLNKRFRAPETLTVKDLRLISKILKVKIEI